MKKEIAVKYQQMQLNPKPMTYLEMTEKEMGSLSVVGDDDDDFELSSQFTQSIAFTIPPISESKEPSAPIPVIEDPPSLSPLGDSVESPLPSLTPPSSDSRPSERPKSEDDALFDLVTKDISESDQRRRKRRPNRLAGGVRTATGGFVIYCPYGCRFEVKDSHRGMQGRCPRCKAPFIVPVDPPDFSVGKKGDAIAAAGAVGTSESTNGYSCWLKDQHLHAIAPDKLKLKADSLLKEYADFDVGFLKEQMLVVSLAKKGGGGLFGGGGDKKKVEARDALLLQLKEGKPVTELTAAEKQVFSLEQIKQLRVVQPVANRAESLFAGVPVFGAGRIAVQLPFSDDPKAVPQYLSFTLTEFRTFVSALQSSYGISGFGEGCGAPLEDAYDEYTCHSTNATFKALRHLDYYKADSAIKLAPTGYKCGSCGVAISEAGRAKDNLGGKDGKGIAKAKCPKCQQKLGDNPLLSLAPAVAAPEETPIKPAS